jgi:hypothetical protein
MHFWYTVGVTRQVSYSIHSVSKSVQMEMIVTTSALRVIKLGLGKLVPQLTNGCPGWKISSVIDGDPRLSTPRVDRCRTVAGCDYSGCTFFC